MTIYSIEIQNQNGDTLERFATDAKTAKAAETRVKNAAKRNPWSKVFLSFHRDSDGQSGYINRFGGAGFNGQPW